MNNNEIDFVLIWVDNNDEEWLKSFQQYKYSEQRESSERFRDWDNLHYWFRAVEKNANWVRKIHFVTCGHYPKWLNKAHPKLNLVSHQDYIDLEHLPTFSSHVIEINLHKIQGLSEKFVFFNDDFFLLNPTMQEDFFQNDLPCDAMILNAHAGDGVSHIIMNNLLVLNKYFHKKQVIKNNIWKWLNLKYGVNLLRSFCLLPW
nr:stealth family protein [Alysiella crassa]UOP08008.1 stealth family protein [Alysiella crassa]